MKSLSEIAAVTVLLFATSAWAQQPTVHELLASPESTHIFFFDASLEPVLRIDSGDRVRMETATGNPRWFEALGVPRDRIPPVQRQSKFLLALTH